MILLLRLARKILREQRWTLLFCFVLLGVFFTIGTYLYTKFGDLSMEAMTDLSPELMQTLLGGMLGGIDPLETWLVTLFIHPLVLTLYSVVAVAITARSLAGEIDRGTIDLVLSCPVPRWQLVVSTTAVMLLSHAVMTLIVWRALLFGLELGAIDPPESLPAFRLVALNLFALFCAAGGVALLFSATTSEQGRAVGRSLGFVVLSFFVNLIAGLWQKVSWLGVISIFHYHRPQPVVTGGPGFLWSMAVLLGLFAACFVLALVFFRRRDIATV